MSDSGIPFKSQKTVEREDNIRIQALCALMNTKIGLTETGCWLWSGELDAQGYGVIRVVYGRGVQYGPNGDYMRGGKTRFFKVHRLSFEYYKHSEKVPGFVVRHTCDVRHCWNPAHLIEGTHKQNTQDMIQRGRASWQKRKVIAAMAAPRNVSPLAAAVLENERVRRIRKGNSNHGNL
jgi:hypothetical protein